MENDNNLYTFVYLVIIRVFVCIFLAQLLLPFKYITHNHSVMWFLCNWIKRFFQQHLSFSVDHGLQFSQFTVCCLHRELYRLSNNNLRTLLYHRRNSCIGIYRQFICRTHSLFISIWSHQRSQSTHLHPNEARSKTFSPHQLCIQYDCINYHERQHGI